jgi:E3 ubiquitin-protein ligase RNF1/2
LAFKPKKMPAQKRSYETLQKEDDALLRRQQDHTNNNHEQKQEPRSDIDDDGGVGERTCANISTITTSTSSRFVHFVLDSITVLG